jgi:hypothetical protein
LLADIAHKLYFASKLYFVIFFLALNDYDKSNIKAPKRPVTKKPLIFLELLYDTDGN